VHFVQQSALQHTVILLSTASSVNCFVIWEFGHLVPFGLHSPRLFLAVFAFVLALLISERFLVSPHFVFWHTLHADVCCCMIMSVVSTIQQRKCLCWTIQRCVMMATPSFRASHAMMVQPTRLTCKATGSTSGTVQVSHILTCNGQDERNN